MMSAARIASGRSSGAVHRGCRGKRRHKAKEPVMRLGNARARATIFKGKTRKNAGKATGNGRLRASGKISEVIGKLRLNGGKARSRVKR